MKKYLIPVLIVFLCFSIVTSCRDSTEEPSESPPEISDGDVVGITVNRPPFEDGGQVIPCKVIDNYDSWKSFMEAEYGISINIEVIPSLHASGILTATYYPSAIKNGGMTGLIEMNYKDYANIPVLKNLGLILPIDEYLKDNSTYQTLHPSMRDAFVLPDGKTWALSATTSTSIYSRKIRREWLEELDIGLPSNTDELYAMSKAFAYDDPNGNGLADEHGIDVYFSRTPEGLKDIFTAYDCYLSNFGRSSIAYDYSTGAYEDAMLKPEMKEALEYLKGMVEEKILFTNMEWSFSAVDSIINGNYYGESARTISDDPDVYDQVYTLSAEDKKSIWVKGPEKCFVITANTKDPEKVINSFVDAFYTDIDGMLAGVYGEENVNYSIDGNTIVNAWGGDMQEKFSKNVLLLRPDYRLLYENEMELSESWLEGKVDHMEVMNRFSGENTIIDLFMPLHSDYRKIQTVFTEKLNYFIENAATVDIEDFIEDYIADSKKAGFKEILEDMNSDYGAVQKYGY